MDGGLESRCVVRVYGADGAVRLRHRTSEKCAPTIEKSLAERHVRKE